MNDFNRKRFFHLETPNCEHGDAAQIATHAKDAGLTHLVVKIADGTMIYNGNWGDPKDYTTPVVSAIRTRGIKVWGWTTSMEIIPSTKPVAITRIRQYNLDGYVIDVEKQIKTVAKKLQQKIHDPGASCLSGSNYRTQPYRYPSLHPQIPWTEFLEQCDSICRRYIG